ncbi:MAG TPA: sterol desaturase family protein [Cytophagaceae bacterium]|jgi:sterol desaturase/sphingolipid hydroxylase (fatty acid hydroxylase superfamily)|nr:sterol desaturase family protein [Cytophagaceae bacterium]
MAKQFVSDKDESVRMFKSDFLESFTKVHYLTPLVIFLPVIGYFLYKSIFVYGLNYLLLIGLLAGGILAWTFTEYILHRFVFHFVPASKFGKRLHFIFHGVHHDYPNDSRRLVMAPSISITLAVIFYTIYYYLMGEVYVAPFFTGYVTGYVFYDLTHYAIHHFNFKNKFWLDLKKHHMVHHYMDGNNGYGVSSKIWDHVFGTTYKKK